MTREIKYKTWDAYNKRMLWIISMHNLLYWDTPEWIYTNWMPNECLDFLQYTWLKDKNWKEIYKGDILYAGCYPAKNKYKVCFWIAKINDNEDYGDNQISWFYLEDKKTKYHFDNVSNYEVIWNIYENPELISKT